MLCRVAKGKVFRPVKRHLTPGRQLQNHKAPIPAVKSRTWRLALQVECQARNFAKCCAASRSLNAIQTPCDACAVWLVEDHVVDPGPFTSNLDDKSLQRGIPKSAALQGAKPIGRLIVGLQDKLAIRGYRDAIRCRSALEIAHAPLAEFKVSTIAGRKTLKHDVFDHWLERCRQTDNVALAIREKGDRKPVWEETIRHLRELKCLVVAMCHWREHAAPRPV